MCGKVIYLSGPIANGGHDSYPAKKMYNNVRRAEELMYVLMKKGWSVICPHLSYYAWIHWEHDIPWDRWIVQDYDFVERSDAIFYMVPEVYGESKGALREVEHAKKHNIPVYTEIKDVPDVLMNELKV